MTRLHLTPLTLHHDEFILTLLNTPGWLRFIGDRNIKNTADARAYINKITGNPILNYQVVMLKDTDLPIGIITLIKRDYLEYPDFGFAFLPEYGKMGYAFEAASFVLSGLSAAKKTSRVLAILLAENVASVALLLKLGFVWEGHTIDKDGGERLEIYAFELMGEGS